MGQRAYCHLDHPAGDVEADRWCETYHRPQMPRTPFRWFPGIPSRNAFTYASLSGTDVKVTHLTLLATVIVEEIDSDQMPLRTLSTIDVDGRNDRQTIETMLSGLGMVAA